MKKLLIALVWLTTFPAQALEHCAQSSADLEAALIQASAEAIGLQGAVATIKLRNGVDYSVDIASPMWDATFDKLELRGGYSDPACLVRDPGSDQAQLTLGGFNSFSIGDALAVEDITLILARRLDVWIDSAASIAFRRNQLMLDGEDARILGLYRGNTSDPIDLRMIGNVITSIQGLSDLAPQACAVTFSNSFVSHGGGDADERTGPADVFIVNNTIAETGLRGICLDQATQALVANNIVQDTPLGSVVDLMPEHSTPVTLRNNVFESSTQLPSTPVNVGNVFDNPLFDGALSPSFQLLPQSPAVNTGWMGAAALVGNIDLLGNVRNVGAAVDRGAFETSINNQGTSIVVESALDDGPKTLRQAIISANLSTGTPQRITFDLGGGPNDCGPGNPIELAKPLPEITDDLEIDGYGGLATPNTATVGFDASLCIVLADKINDGVTVDKGFVVPATADGVKLTVRGVDFRSFSYAAIALFGGENHVVQGNAFGALTPANTLGRGVLVDAAVPGVLIGGYLPADRNHVGSAAQAAIQVQGDNASVIGNLIGTGRDGFADAAFRNNKGVTVDGDHNFVAHNTISSSLTDGMLILGNGNTVQSNLIGYNDALACAQPSCIASQPNQRGVRLLGDANRVFDNRIGHSTKQGIVVATNASANEVRNNVIEHNGGLGIDLRSDELPDDPQITDMLELVSAANGGQNFPVITSASGQPRPPGSTADAIGAVSGTLSTRNGTYTIEIFANQLCDASEHGEGEEPIGSGTVVISSAGSINGVAHDGTAPFSIAVSSPMDLLGRTVSATARSAAGNTSEFSACQSFTVSNTAPTLATVSLAIPRGTPANTSIATLQAVDDGLPAPTQVTYSLLTALVPFSVSPEGVLRVTQNDIFEATSIYNLDVKVDDGEKSTTGVVTIRPADLFRDGFEGDEAP